MTDLVLKYNALNKTAQKQVNDYKSKVNYKSRILSVSTWSDSDLEIFRNNQTLFNSWQIEEW